MLMVQPVLAGADPGGAGAEHTQSWQWATSRDGQTVLDHGCDVTALLPRDPDVVLVLPLLATSWHRIALPKINAARLRQALDGVLEDRLLSDPAQVHLALAPGLQPGQTGWVAACERAPVAQWLAQLQAAERPAHRIVPDLCPQDPPALHALVCAGTPWLVAVQAHGVQTVPLPTEPYRSTPTHAPHATSHAAHPLPSHQGLPCLAEPACAAAAEAVLDAPATVHTTAQRLLSSALSGWNLAQFDLSLSAGARRSQRWGQTLRHLLHAPQWRTTRWGAGVLAVVLLLNLQGLAWQERRSLQAKQAEIAQRLTQAFPAIGLVLDAPRQMQQAVSRLQRASGEPSPHDLEGFLQSFGQFAQVDIDIIAIQYTPTGVAATLAAVAPERVDALRTHLRAQGWTTEFAAPILNARPLADTAATTGARRANPSSGQP
jgi:general secretion pathway protein L